MPFIREKKEAVSLADLLYAMPLLWLSCAYLGGLVFACWTDQPWQVWATALFASLTLIFFQRYIPSYLWIYWNKLSSLPLCLVVFVFFIGSIRYQTSLPQNDPHNLEWYCNKQKSIAEGIVVTSPQVGKNQISLRVQVEKLSLLDEQNRIITTSDSPRGLLLAYVADDKDWFYGDRVRIRGELETIDNGNRASFRDTLFRQGIQAVIPYAQVDLLERGQGVWWYQAAESIRLFSKQIIYRQIPQPEGALLSGILLGDDNDLPDELQSNFRDTGTSHIIAISGFNMAIVAGLLTFFVMKLMPRFWGFWVVLGGIVFYTLITGATPSVVRAAVMGCMGLLGNLIGRRQTGINSLVFSAALMSGFDPFLPWDISFQLSFGATLGLVLYAEPLEKFVVSVLTPRLPEGWLHHWMDWISEFFLCTLAAQITTLPIMIYHFQQISLSALLANILVLPVQPAVMFFGGAALGLGMLVPTLGQLLSYPAWLLLVYTTHLISILAKIEGGVLFIETIPVWGIALIYLGMLCFTPLFSQSLGHFKRFVTPTGLFIACGLMAAFVVRTALSMPDGKMHVTLLGGDTQTTLLIRAPGGQTVLINGATPKGTLSSDVGKRLPPTERKIDLWLVTDPSKEVIREFELLNHRFLPQLIYFSSPVSMNSTWSRLSDKLVLQRAGVNPLELGQIFDLGAGARLVVLSASDEATIFWLEWKNFRVLIPGGLEAPTGKKELAGFPTGSLLILGKTDLEDGQKPDQWSQLEPLAILARGENDRGSENWINMDQKGWIEIESDGNNLWMSSEY